VAGKFRITHNGGNFEVVKDSSIDVHSVSVVIAPEVKDGRYQMTAIMLDGEVIPLDNVYSTVSGKTDADCYLKEMTFLFYIGKGRSAEIKNLKVERGFDDMVLSTDFADGAETDEDGINIMSSEKLSENAMNGKIKVYSGDELISDPGIVISYNADGKGWLKWTV